MPNCELYFPLFFVKSQLQFWNISTVRSLTITFKNVLDFLVQTSGQVAFK